MPSLEGNLLTHWHQITSEETRDSRLSYGEDPKSLSHLGFAYHRVVTDRRTDRIPIANTRSQQYLPVQLSRVKNDVTRIEVYWMLFLWYSFPCTLNLETFPKT